ncbi:MAG TPA: hypothetical protein VLB47_02050, partial [Solirubrobacteraceae bacterium]|nr:hypothetical protein [Solirubrobacteraceae bacterium]
MTDGESRPRPVLATALAVALLCAGLVLVAIDPGTVVHELAPTLVVCAVVAELLAARVSSRLAASGGFIAGMLAVGFLGPLVAFVVPMAGHLASWVAERYRWRAFLINVAGSSS